MRGGGTTRWLRSAFAADYGCERAIFPPDCFTLSLGKGRSLKAFFAARERELAEEMEGRPFEVEIRFLEDRDHERPREQRKKSLDRYQTILAAKTLKSR